MSSANGNKARSVHQLKVTLRGTSPPVWRRLHVPSSMTLGTLHRAIQVAMGWDDSHLHEFVIGGTRYGNDDGGGWDSPPKNESTARLARVARPGDRFRYDYDIGDNWQHEIVVEKVMPAAPGTTYPVVVRGRRACPPEDCGGVGGYAELLGVLADPDDEQHEELLEWVGGPIDPEAFDIDSVNAWLQAGAKAFC